MSAAQDTRSSGRPRHLWAVGIIGFLWSSMGVVAFLLTQLAFEKVTADYSPEQREYFASLPLWSNVFWGIGVFGGVIGCLLLLLKKRLAFPVLLASVIGAIVSNLSGLFLYGGMEAMEGAGALGFAVFIIAIAAALAWYARAMIGKGVLR